MNFHTVQQQTIESQVYIKLIRIIKKLDKNMSTCRAKWKVKEYFLMYSPKPATELIKDGRMSLIKLPQTASGKS